MININIAGDFCVKNLNGLKFGSELREELSKSEINIVNLESPIKAKGAIPIKKSGPHHYQDNMVPSFLGDNGFNVISLANNHIMDYGEESLVTTKQCFKDALLIGAGTFEDAYSVKVVSIDGTDIGFMSITQFEFGVLDEDAYNDNKVGTAWMCHPYVDEIIIKAKLKCDYLFVLPHAGLELYELPLPEIRTLYRHFINIGADGVIGSHPHVPQCWEFYKEKPLVYSLGNFCFDKEHAYELWFYGLIAQLQLSGGKIDLYIKTIHYDIRKRIVDIINSLKLNKTLESNNAIFHNEKDYIKSVNKKCLSLESYYDTLYEMSGFIKPTLQKCLGVIKHVLFTSKKEGLYNKAHFINNIRCETHRWIQSRIYELTFNKQNQ